MIALIQITNTEIFPFIVILIFKLSTRRVLFKKMANFTGELLQSYKQLEGEIFRILLKHVSNPLSASVFPICKTAPLIKKLKNAIQASGLADYIKYIYQALISQSELLNKNSCKRLLFDFIFSRGEGVFRVCFFHF